MAAIDFRRRLESAGFTVEEIDLVAQLTDDDSQTICSLNPIGNGHWQKVSFARYIEIRNAS